MATETADSKPVRGSIDALEQSLDQLGLDSAILMADEAGWRVTLWCDSELQEEAERVPVFTGRGSDMRLALRGALSKASKVAR